MIGRFNDRMNQTTYLDEDLPTGWVWNGMIVHQGVLLARCLQQQCSLGRRGSSNRIGRDVPIVWLIDLLVDDRGLLQ